MFRDQIPRNQIEEKKEKSRKMRNWKKKEKSYYPKSLTIKTIFLLSTDHSVSTRCRTIHN